jgi:hypothetical protein
MRKTLGVAVLMLAFCCPALAGEIPNPPAPTPPPPPVNAVQEPTINGVMSTPDISERLTQITLELLAVLPSIL